MKKALIVIISLIMALLLISCSSNGTEKQSTESKSQTETTSEGGTFDFISALSGKGPTDIIFGKKSEEVKNDIIEAGKSMGIDVSFDSEGKMTIDDGKGTIVRQNTDGSWMVKDANGSWAQLGGEWPDNEFTRQVPKPEFTLVGAALDNDNFAVAFNNVTLEQIKAYAEKIKDSGFNLNVDVQDKTVLGVTMYTFEADNAAGYHVTIKIVSGVSGLTISK